MKEINVLNNQMKHNLIFGAINQIWSSRTDDKLFADKE